MHKNSRRYLSRARCFAGAFCASLILTAAPGARAAVTETVLHASRPAQTARVLVPV